MDGWNSGDAYRELLAGDSGMLSVLGMSVNQFAIACGVTRVAVYHYLDGTNVPSLQTLTKMAEVMNIPIEVLKESLPYSERGRTSGIKGM